MGRDLGVTALPLSITATGWAKHHTFFLACLAISTARASSLACWIPAACHAHILAYQTLKHWIALHNTSTQLGIGILLAVTLPTGIMGLGWRSKSWRMAHRPDWCSCLAALLSGWHRELRMLTPVRAHWVRPQPPLGWIGSSAACGDFIVWHCAIGAIPSQLYSKAMVGFMWTLLFLVLFISLMAQGALSP